MPRHMEACRYGAATFNCGTEQVQGNLLSRTNPGTVAPGARGRLTFPIIQDLDARGHSRVSHTNAVRLHLGVRDKKAALPCAH